MRIKKIGTVAAVAALLTGCETLIAHYTLSESAISKIAVGNAAVNFCLSQNAIDKDLAYTFNNASAQILDISVLDRDLYKRIYEENLAMATEESSNASSECAEFEAMLPEMNESLINFYSRIASQLSQARAAEWQQMAEMANSFGRPWGGAAATPNYAATYSWPQLNYVDQPAAANYLVNTSRGMVQCRVTNKNYVFCM